MEANRDNVMEAQVRRAVQKAVKQLLEDIKDEPTLVIESNDSEAGMSGQTIADIRTWLFRRR